MEEFLARLLGPLALAAVTDMVVVAFMHKHPGAAGFFLLYLIWLVIVNGGLLILDSDDLDW